MRIPKTPLLGAILLFALPASGDIGSSRSLQRESRTPAAKVLLPPTRVPLSFEANRGQTDPSVRFLARPRGYRAFFTDAETVFVLPRGTGEAPDARLRIPPSPAVSDVVRMRFAGARPAALVAGTPLAGRSHYFTGNDPARWIREVPHFGAVAARGLYRGVALRWRGLPGGRLEYDLDLDAGADERVVAMEFEGARSVEVDASGALLVRTAGGVLRHGRPRAFQEIGGETREVAVEFALRGGTRAGFRLGRHDPSWPVLIDPEIDYSTFLGGGNIDTIQSVASDGSGAAYVAGGTGSNNFPTSNAYQPSYRNFEEAFITKYNAAGSALVYSTYLSGSERDYALGLAVDANGVATVCGMTESTNFPTSSAIQIAKSGPSDAFVAKLGSTGSTLVHSTYLGGTATDFSFDVHLTSDGAAVVCGETTSTNFPTTVGAFDVTSNGGLDGFVSKISANGGTLAWSTFLGGGSGDEPLGVVVDASDRPVIVGLTFSTDFPTSQPIQADIAGDADVFVTKLASDGAGLSWSTYLGGTGADYGFAVALGTEGQVWLTGTTRSTDFPVQGAFQDVSANEDEAFVTRISGAGDSIEFSTYLGGNSTDSGNGIAVDLDDTAVVVGFTGSTDFPVVDAVQEELGGGIDIFVTMFRPTAPDPPFSTYLGGTGDDRANAVALDPLARIFVGGYMNGSASTYPVLNPVQGPGGNSWDAVFTTIERLPFAPGGLTAKLIDLTAVEIRWTPVPGGVTGYRLERSVDGGGFTTLATTSADTAIHVDAGLTPLTEYTYRVLSLAGAYASEPSEEVSVTTPPTPTSPPAAPSDLVATIVSPRRVDLAWQDNSDNEGYFLLSRAPAGALYSTLATPRLGDTSRTDLTPLPGRTYSYKIRAVNPTGASLDSNVETVTMPTTLTVTLVQGRAVDKPDPGRDSLKLSGTLSYGPDALSAAFDPAAQAFSLRLGTIEAPPLVDLLAGDEGWTLTRKGVWTWKSPRGALNKAKLTVNPVLGTWTAKLRRLTFPAAPTNPVRVTVTLGTDAGHQEADWTLPTKTGKVKFPVPVAE